MKPRRIQRRRLKGWKSPEGVIYCGRPTMWGNPFETAHEFDVWLKYGTKQALIRVGVCLPEKATQAMEERRIRIMESLPDLRGHDLSCWCSLDKHCHVETLLEMANR